MNSLMSALMAKHTPPMNAAVMNGLACLHMKNAEEYIHAVFTGVNKSLQQHGLVYVGYERCTAEEEYMESTKVRNNKRIYDLAPTDIYMVRYMFEFNGKPIPPRYIYLPFVGPGGLMRISGSLYHLSPVLSDKVISPDNHSVFVRLLRDKVTFWRKGYAMVINGKRGSTEICWSQIYRKQNDKRRIQATTKALTSVAHYLFAKFGFTDTFQKYAGFVPLVSEGGFSPESHPPEQWIIAESTAATSHIKPRTYIGEYYTPTRLQLAIPREHWNPMMQALVAGLFYVVDHFPDRLKTESLDSTTVWMILLGEIVFSAQFGANKLFQNIQEHFSSLDNCVDKIIVEKLAEIGYNIDNFYDLMAMIMGTWNDLVSKNERSSLSMYGKNLEILYYALYPITSDIFMANFKLNKQASKKPLTENDVIEAFNRNLKSRAIFELAADSIVAESVSYSGDHMYPKITSRLASQENWQGQGGGRRRRLVIGPDQHLNVSQIEVGSVLFLSKANPSPTTRINPFVHVDLATGTIVRNPDMVKLLDHTQQLLDKK
jgi:hypothetical protein